MAGERTPRPPAAGCGRRVRPRLSRLDSRSVQGTIAGVIRRCSEQESTEILEIINAAAEAYRGHVPEDRLGDPYMPGEELAAEIADGVEFYGVETEGRLVAVMGIQDRGDVALIRHAYTHPAAQRRGHGSALLSHLLEGWEKPVLVGTWEAARWAIRFYEKHGFTLAGEEEKTRLLQRYWNVPQRQIETSVVLVRGEWKGVLE